VCVCEREREREREREIYNKVQLAESCCQVDGTSASYFEGLRFRLGFVMVFSLSFSQSLQIN